ncbi:hypothetical protein ONZ70_003798 [Vibrio fluvialis]|nr:hypothetical protein [Vibrio fluvialis]
MKNHILNRIIKGTLSSQYGQLITIAFQLISVPVFLKYWGTDKYGEWLLLLTIPMFVSMMELGVFAVVVNRITVGVSDGKRNIKTIASTLNSFIIYLIVSFLLLYTSLIFFELGKDYYIYCLLISYSFALLLCNYYTTLTRVTKEYHFGTFVNHSIRLIEYVFIILSVYFKFEIITTILIMLIVRLSLVLFFSLYLMKRYYWLRLIGVSKFEFFSHLGGKKVFNYSLLPISFLLNNQAPVLIIGYTLGNEYVVVFSTLRTFFRFLNQFVTSLTNSSWQEFSHLKIMNEMSKIKILLNKISLFSLLVSVIAFLSYVFFGPYILECWLKGSLVYSEPVYLTLLLSIIMFTLWQPYHVYLSATDNYNFHSRFYFVVQIFSMTALFYFSSSLMALSLILLVAELIMFIAVLFFVKFDFSRSVANGSS